MNRLRIAAAAAALLAFIGAALAQGVTGKTVRVIVPFPPGGTADVISRLLTDQAGKSGQAFVVENRPGGGTVIATEQVSRAAADGTTILIVSNSFIINPSVRKNLSYDPLTSFAPICLIANSPQILAVNVSSPYKTLADYVAAAKAKPGQISYAAVGPATTQHIAMEHFKRLAGIELTYVPYTGGAPATTALLGGHVDAVLANFSEHGEQIASGKLRALGVAAHERMALLKDVPTFEEQGYKDFVSSAIFGYVAPANTPKETIGQLGTMLTAAAQTPDVQAKLSSQGLELATMNAEQFGALLKSQHELYARIIKEANIKVE
jgi:tripartite-type tricarboxylate transporter receptor subunit TctC